jgi:hypothetical protein
MLWRAGVGRGPLEALTRSASALARGTVLLLARPPEEPVGENPQGSAT